MPQLLLHAVRGGLGKGIKFTPQLLDIVCHTGDTLFEGNVLSYGSTNRRGSMASCLYF